MTTIILTIIGILLAAAAALMVIFYGGDAFNSGSVGAQANTYQNAGTNVIAASQLAATDAVVFDLADTRYLKEAPALPEGSSADLTAPVAGTPDPDGAGPLTATAGVSGMYQVALPTATGNNSTQVCARINTNLKRATPTALGQGKMGCFDNTFYATL